MLTLGYKASAEQFGPRDLLAFSIHAERAGFDSVFVSDHFQPWRHTDGHAPNCLVWLGALAMRTQRVTIGTSVLTPSFRYHPAIVAQAFATLGSLAGADRRSCWASAPASRSTRCRWGSSGRTRRSGSPGLKEATELIRRLWTEELVTFEGQFFKTQNATIYDLPERPVELWIAASGPAAARLAGRVADGFICTSGKGMELYSETLLPAVAEGAEKAGRTTAGREDDRGQGLVRLRPPAGAPGLRHLGGLALPGETKMGVDDPREMERLRLGAADRDGGSPLAGLGRPRRAHRADPALHRAGLHPPRLPLAGQQPVAVHQRLRARHPRLEGPRLRERWGSARTSGDRTQRPVDGHL